MSGLSTHVLDTSLGRPAAGLRVVLQRRASGGEFECIARCQTDAQGRVADLLSGAPLVAGIYQLCFSSGDYFRAQHRATLYPAVHVLFEVAAEPGGQHYHIPLLLNPYGYSTYRGT